MHRPLALLMASLLVSGCSTLDSMMLNGVISKESSTALGEFYAFAQVCHDVGAFDAGASDLYQAAVEHHLDVSTFHQAEFSDAQYRVYTTYFQSDPDVIFQQCEDMRADADAAYTLLDKNLRAIKVERAYSLLDSVIVITCLSP